MKRIVGIILFVVLVASVYAQSEHQVYGIKSGYVEYELTGSTVGTKKLWWDNYGNQSRTEINATTTTKMFGMKNEVVENSINIINNNTYWTIDLNENTGMTGSFGDDDASVTEDMTEAEREEYSTQMMEAFGGEIKGQETIHGVVCDIYEVFGAQSWIYEGVSLKADVSVLGIENKEMSTKFEKNIAIDASQFIAPKDIEYIDMDAMEQNMYDNYDE